MSKLSTQAILAIIIVVFFMIVTGIIAIYGFANDIQGSSAITITYLKEYSSIFTGIIGTIIGYFFGKGEEKKV